MHPECPWSRVQDQLKTPLIMTTWNVVARRALRLAASSAGRCGLLVVWSSWPLERPSRDRGEFFNLAVRARRFQLILDSAPGTFWVHGCPPTPTSHARRPPSANGSLPRSFGGEHGAAREFSIPRFWRAGEPRQGSLSTLSARVALVGAPNPLSRIVNTAIVTLGGKRRKHRRPVEIVPRSAHIAPQAVKGRFIQRS